MKGKVEKSMRGVPMKLEPRRVHVFKGGRSRRLRKNQWVPK